MEEKTWWIPFDEMEAFMRAAFEAVGVPPEDAAVSADVLITSDKRGIDSHGVSRMKPFYIDRIREGVQLAVTNFEVVKETETTAVVDGHNGMGHVIAKRAMQMAIDKARRWGLGMVAVRNSTHYGIAGYYPMMAASQGCIGLTGTNARPAIAPTFSVENMLGTNPLTAACPTDEEFPFVLDCATSISQRGKVEVYARRGKTMPAGWVIGQDGETLTDPAQTLKDLLAGKAAMTPLGGPGEDLSGYKGYGYATLVEILSAALQDGNFLKGINGKDEHGNKAPYRLGHWFLAIDVEHFIPLPVFKAIAGSICRQLRAAKKAPGHDRIWTAGEKEHDAWAYRKDKGVPFNASLVTEFNALRQELGLTNRFPWD
jgi:LDH2 family malate/lactate/ureidoglycolate dehydrogenase